MAVALLRRVRQLLDVDAASITDGKVLAWDAATGRFIGTTSGGGGGDVEAHRADTTNVHGIPDTAALQTAVDASTAHTALTAGAHNLTALLGAKADLVGGLVPTAQLPALAITDVFPVASQAAMLALTAQRGDIAVRSDLNQSFILAAEPATVLANWTLLPTPTDAVLSVSGRTGAVVLAKADVGLGSVDNTADAAKPVSTAQAAADALAAQRSANLSDLASAATARTNLGLGTAATQATTAFDAAGAAAAAQAASQPSDTDLTAIAALSTTAYGRAFLTLTDAGAGRTALGLGTAAVQNTEAFDPAGSAASAQAASQPVDSDLTAIAALTTTVFGRSLLMQVDAAAVRSTISAQQADAELDALAGLTSAADKLPYFTGAGTAALTNLSAYGRTLIDDADAATARGTIGLSAIDNTSDAAKPVSTAQLAALDLKASIQNPWAPTGSVAVVGGGRAVALSNQALLTSGTLRLVGELVLPKGQAVNGITAMSGTQAAVTPTNQWFCLVRLSDLAVLRKTADDLTAAWAALTPKSLSLSSAYTPATDEAVALGVLVVAGTAPSLTGWSVAAINLSAIPPTLGGNSTTGLTTPASLGATANAPTASSQMFWGYVS